MPFFAPFAPLRETFFPPRLRIPGAGCYRRGRQASRHAISCSQPGRRTLLAGIETRPGSGFQNFGKAAGSLSNSPSHLSRLAHGVGGRGSLRRHRPIHRQRLYLRRRRHAAGEDGAMRRRGGHHRRSALSAGAARDLRSADLALRPRTRRAAANHLPGRGGNAPSDALRARGSRAPVGRPGARRTDHRQRHGARHRYRRSQRRAGARRRTPSRYWDAAWTWCTLRRTASWRRTWRSRD